MINFEARQSVHAQWVKENFGGTYGQTHHPLLGIMEEVGELCHAHLKCEQDIRTNEGHEADRADAVGDIVIYIMDYCNRVGLDLETCINDAHREVLERDWTRHPEKGVDSK